MIRTVIIEDEEASRILLHVLLSDYITDVDVVGEAASVEEAITLINRTNPDVVLLDIEIIGGTGFDVVSQLNTSKTLIVFTTSYDQFGIQAIKNNAFDYLLKPIVVKELIDVFERAKITLNEKRLLSQLQEESNISQDAKKILLKDSNQQQIVLVNDIIMVQAEGSYAQFYFKDGSKMLISKTLKQIENDFPDIFFRTHKSYLVNLDHAQKWEVVRGGNLTLSNHFVVPISYRRKSDFLMVIQNKLDSNA